MLELLSSLNFLQFEFPFLLSLSEIRSGSLCFTLEFGGFCFDFGNGSLGSCFPLSFSSVSCGILSLCKGFGCVKLCLSTISLLGISSLLLESLSLCFILSSLLLFLLSSSLLFVGRLIFSLCLGSCGCVLFSSCFVLFGILILVLLSDLLLLISNLGLFGLLSFLDDLDLLLGFFSGLCLRTRRQLDLVFDLLEFHHAHIEFVHRLCLLEVHDVVSITEALLGMLSEGI